jgi:hypothetical protein
MKYPWSGMLLLRFDKNSTAKALWEWDQIYLILTPLNRYENQIGELAEKTTGHAVNNSYLRAIRDPKTWEIVFCGVHLWAVQDCQIALAFSFNFPHIVTENNSCHY